MSGKWGVYASRGTGTREKGVALTVGSLNGWWRKQCVLRVRAPLSLRVHGCHRLPLSLTYKCRTKTSVPGASRPSELGLPEGPESWPGVF